MKLTSKRSSIVFVLAIFCIALATLVPISPKTSAAFAAESEAHSTWLRPMVIQANPTATRFTTGVTELPAQAFSFLDQSCA